MPEESIAAYLNNIITFIIFIIVIASIFVLIFLLSRTLTRKASNRNDFKDIGIKEEVAAPGQRNIMPDYKEDPNQRKNIFILGVIFIVIILFILLILCVYNFSMNPSAGLNLFSIIGIIFNLIFVTVYIVKSKIIN